MEILNPGDKWSKEVKCGSCGAMLKVEEADVKREPSFDGNSYYFRCPSCRHKNNLATGISLKNVSADNCGLPRHVLENATSEN
jgi:predicted RNA-binding Zn-ribbon protein involved in translation (DUF1610 family)